MKRKDFEQPMKEEQKIIEKLSEELKDVEIPKSLEPDQVEKMLSAKRRKKSSVFLKYASAAAGAVLVLGVAAYGLFHLNSGNAQTDESVAESAAGNADSAEEGIQTAESYEEICEYIQNVWEEQNTSSLARDGGVFTTEESTADMAEVQGESGSVQSDGAESGMSAGTAEESSDVYSETNTREAEVGEADIVKTDGNYIYILNQNTIDIVDIRSREMKAAGSIPLGAEVYPSEIYVEDGKLVAFYSKTEQTESGSDEYGADYREYTVAETFDVSDPASPRRLGEVRQSGNYHSVRITDGYIYLFSNYYVPYGTGLSEPEDYIPLVQGKALESGAIYMPQTEKGNRYMVISSFALDNPEETLDSKAILSADGTCYVSTDNIYIYESVFDTEEDYNQTSIRKIAYDKGELKGIAQTKVWGYVKDSFCIDEYEGNLRVVTTVDPMAWYEDDGISLFDSIFYPDTAVEEESSNALYVLDENLEVTGKIEKLAPDEDVYSARFMGDIGYFVTYEQVDPLFSVDLSDPENPEIIGALKIPGFSEYLHPYGEGLLLGIGMETDMAGATSGVKLSMFDISDPADVSEVHKEVLEGIYSTDVVYDYRMALISHERNLIGFSAYGEQQHYYVYSYDPDTGFTCLLDKELGYVNHLRGLYAGNVLYLVEGNAVESFDLGTFEKIDDIVL